MIRRLYELLTGRPYITTRSMVDEFGPPPAVRYPELLDYTDEELMRRDRDELLAEIRARRAAARRRQREEVRQ